ncbi:MAG: molybdopterin-dependent oxidoreductase [Desulfuromusa sp.]|nr:molybdopterin-dependent oxidoreductase [Desulfuromusa sp.]
MGKEKSHPYEALKNQKEFKASALEARQHTWRTVEPTSSEKRETLFSICRGCMQGDCATQVHLKNGIVEKIEGNPALPPNYGSLCPRGNSAIMNLYNPYRIKTPLKRTNPQKGLDIDPGWVEITWEEALETTARKMKEAKEYDPRSLVISEGWGNRDTILRTPFIRAFGSPNEVGSHGGACTVHYATGLVQHSFPVATVDLEYCNYHITLGRSLGPNFATVGGSRKFSKAIERGMKLVVVDPRCSYEAAKGEWVPIKPTTDLAFLLGLAHVMMHEIGIYDQFFMKYRTNAPYLIAGDGSYLRDKTTEKPMIWDLVEQKAKPFSAEFTDIALEGTFQVDGAACKTGFTAIKEQFSQYSPEWAEQITDVPAATTRRIAREFVQEARIGSTIEIDGVTLPYRPVSLNTERNVTNHRGGTYADLVGKLINMLVGAIEVPGSCLSCGYRGPVLKPTEDGTSAPGYEAIPQKWTFPPDHIMLNEFFPHIHHSSLQAAKSILNPEKYYIDYDVQVWLTVGANPVRMCADPQLFVDAFNKIPFSVSIAYHMDEPTFMSDIVLPEHSFLERKRVAAFWPQHQSLSDEVNGLQMIQLRQPVPALFNTWHVDDIFMELADRIGLLKGEGGLNDIINESEDWIIKDDGLTLRGENRLDLNRRYTLEEIYERQVRSWKYNDGTLTISDLEKQGALQHWNPRYTFYNYYWVPGSETRHEFYFINLKKTADELKANFSKHDVHFPGVDDDEYIFSLYEPIPHWVESSELTAEEEFDMWAINWKTPYVSSDVGGVVGNPWLAEIYNQDPWENILINTETAKLKGLQDGDRITVESRYGQTAGRIRVTELIHPKTVGFPGSYGKGACQANPLYRQGPHFDILLPLHEKSIDGISAGQEISAAVKILKKEATL